MRTPQWCQKRAAGIGPSCEYLVGELLADNALYRLRAAQGVIGLADKHDPSRLEAACAKAVTAGAGGAPAAGRAKSDLTTGPPGPRQTLIWSATCRTSHRP